MDLIAFLIGEPSIWTPALVILIGVLYHTVCRQSQKQSVIVIMLDWFFFLCIGYLGLWAGVSHIFFGPFVAQKIGWLPSPFQYEVGVANLSFAVMGFYAFRVRHFQVRVVVMLGFAVWFLGDAAGHIYQLVLMHNKAAYNAGATLVTDIMLPIMGCILLGLCRPKHPLKQ